LTLHRPQAAHPQRPEPFSSMRNITKTALVLFSVLLFSTLLAGCATNPQRGGQPAAQANALRVGVTPNFPPMIFKLRKSLVGVEIDLARALGRELGRPVEFVELSWDAQIPALLQGRTDIIMSAMTATDSRRVRIDFSDPYLGEGLSALLRTDEYQRLRVAGRSIPATSKVGVQTGTVAEAFARQRFGPERITPILSPDTAVFELKRKTVDLFITDSATAIWLASENEADLSEAPLESPVQYLAWGMRKGDYEFEDQVNAILARWLAEGRLQQIVSDWLGDQFELRTVQP
jgi:ABC-type amino acid transport substrate-binding protein